MLCHVYRSIAQDPIVGTDQTDHTFWEAISGEFPSRMSQVGPPRGRGCGIRQIPATRGGAGRVAR